MVDILNDEEYIMRSYTAEIVRDTTNKVTKEVSNARDSFAIKSIVNLCKKTNAGKNVAVQHIIDDYGKTEEEASELVEKYYV